MGLKNVCWKPDRLLLKLKLDQSVDQLSFFIQFDHFYLFTGTGSSCQMYVEACLLNQSGHCPILLYNR